MVVTCSFSDSPSYLGDDHIWPIFQFISFNQSLPKMMGIICNTTSLTVETNNVKKKIFYIHVTSHLYTSVLWGVGSLSHFWSETFRWAHVQQRFFHQMLNTDAQMGGSRKQVWLLYTRGYGYTLFKRVCKWMVANGFVNHKNPKCNPSGFHEIGGQMATVDILATIDTVYWSRKLQEDMGAQSLWGVCYASSCMFENQCLAEVEGLKSDPKKFQL